MDIRTGEIYPSKEAALEAGVLDEFLVELTNNRAERRAIKRATRRRGSGYTK